ncbi:MAG: LamG domain-containing protein, partial [Myxococcales bacterium]|nr:LamG domain-containing protein [Myxococcales bacterium]
TASAALGGLFGPVTPHAIAPGTNPLGVWNFDDCTSSQTQLFDASQLNNTAFRSVGVTCAPGVDGSSAVAIAAKEDIVYVPDQPTFTFEQGVTVAGWFNPTSLAGVKTLFRKRDKDTSSFALLLNAGKFEFVVSLGAGRALSVTSPKKARTGVFQHVAATYDGTTARLYIDGIETTTFAVSGSVPPGPGPLLMGNDGSERRFAGSIDSTLFTTHAITADQVLALLCVRPAQPTVIFPSSPVETPAGVPVAFEISLTNNSTSAACGAMVFDIFTHASTGFDFTLDPPLNSTTPTPPVAPGATQRFTITATPGEGVPAGTLLSFHAHVDEINSQFSDFRDLAMIVSETDPNACAVNTARELMIKSTSVVDDPVRTQFSPGSTDPRNGVWTFKHLVENMAPTPAAAPAMVESLFASMTSARVVNGFSVAGRPGVQQLVLNNWPRTPDGALDLAQAPLRLQAIVNRFDLRNLANGDAGEARFVFAFELDGFPLQATLILEYKLPAASESEVLGWANAFHGLGALGFGETYNAALQVVTERFAGRGARPGRPNASAISQVRTNEISFGDNGLWEMREFRLSAASGLLEPVPVELTPANSFNNSSTLASFINANAAAIIAETHTVPTVFAGQPFQGGAVFNDLGAWFAPGVDNEARHHFSLNTCNGCHSSAETGVPFLQISPRFGNSEAILSGFLTGTSIPDPATGVPRSFNDLQRRNTDLRAIVCADPAARALAKTSLRKGISRVH